LRGGGGRWLRGGGERWLRGGGERWLRGGEERCKCFRYYQSRFFCWH
jgi:hypothetical protein